MKKIFSILLVGFLFLGSLFPKSDMEEVFKIPFLFQHYQNEHSDLSFWEFLKIHYQENVANHSDQDHENLPLQKHNHNLGVPFQFVLPAFELTTLVIESDFPEFKVIYREHYSFLSDKSLLQPPKFS